MEIQWEMMGMIMYMIINYDHPIIKTWLAGQNPRFLWGVKMGKSSTHGWVQLPFLTTMTLRKCKGNHPQTAMLFNDEVVFSSVKQAMFCASLLFLTNYQIGWPVICLSRLPTSK